MWHFRWLVLSQEFLRALAAYGSPPEGAKRVTMYCTGVINISNSPTSLPASPPRRRTTTRECLMEEDEMRESRFRIFAYYIGLRRGQADPTALLYFGFLIEIHTECVCPLPRRPPHRYRHFRPCDRILREKVVGECKKTDRERPFFFHTSLNTPNLYREN